MNESLLVIVRHKGDLKTEENREIEEVSQLAFAGPGDDIDWSTPEWWALGKLAGQIVSVVGILKRRIRVGEVSLEVGGIGGVATHPDYQRRGFGSAVLQRADEYMRDDLNLEFGVLFTETGTIPFYRGIGWKFVEVEMITEIHGVKQPFTTITMVIPLGVKAWPDGMVDLCGPPW